MLRLFSVTGGCGAEPLTALFADKIVSRVDSSWLDQERRTNWLRIDFADGSHLSVATCGVIHLDVAPPPAPLAPPVVDRDPGDEDHR